MHSRSSNPRDSMTLPHPDADLVQSLFRDSSGVRRGLHHEAEAGLAARSPRGRLAPSAAKPARRAHSACGRRRAAARPAPASPAGAAAARRPGSPRTRPTRSGSKPSSRQALRPGAIGRQRGRGAAGRTQRQSGRGSSGSAGAAGASPAPGSAIRASARSRQAGVGSTGGPSASSAPPTPRAAPPCRGRPGRSSGGSPPGGSCPAGARLRRTPAISSVGRVPAAHSPAACHCRGDGATTATADRITGCADGAGTGGRAWTRFSCIRRSTRPTSSPASSARDAAAQAGPAILAGHALVAERRGLAHRPGPRAERRQRRRAPAAGFRPRRAHGSTSRWPRSAPAVGGRRWRRRRRRSPPTAYRFARDAPRSGGGACRDRREPRLRSREALDEVIGALRPARGRRRCRRCCPASASGRWRAARGPDRRGAPTARQRARRRRRRAGRARILLCPLLRHGGAPAAAPALRRRRCRTALDRAVFTSGDAVTVLPFDPRAGTVLLIEQFRAGPYARRDPRPWCIEAVAGRCDRPEPPEATARREAREEAGLELGRLERIAGYYPSPGIAAEYITAFVGRGRPRRRPAASTGSPRSTRTSARWSCRSTRPWRRWRPARSATPR